MDDYQFGNDLREINIDINDIKEEDWVSKLIDGDNFDVRELDVNFFETIDFPDEDELFPIEPLPAYPGQEIYEIYTVKETEITFEESVSVPIEPVNETVKEGTRENKLSCMFSKSVNIFEKNQKIYKTIQPKGAKDPKAEPISCSKCCRQFVHEGGLYRHWDIHIGEILPDIKSENSSKLGNVILCVFCGEVFENFSSSVDHLKKFHIEITEKFNCEVPLSIAENTVGIASSSHEEQKMETAEVAPVTIKNESQEALTVIKFPLPGPTSSSEIFRMININKIFHCEFCDSVFSNMKAMFVHVAIRHAPSASFQCNTCNLKVLTLKELLLHRRDECLNGKEVGKSLYKLACVWACNVCNLEFHGLEKLFLHRHEEFHFFPRLDPKTNELRFHCEICTFMCATAEEFIEHFKSKHQKKAKPDEVSETSERKVKPATSRRGGSHQTSTRPRQFLCEVCGKSYTQSSHLWQHLRFHQGVKPFECKVEGCGRKFTIRPDLNDHVRKCHTGERPYLCTICNKRFLTGSVFYQHRLIHRGERRYGCEECGKRFYRADALKNHLRIHSGEKPHICNVCNKAFRQRGDRDKHVKARHPDAPPLIETKKPKVKSFGRGRIRNNTSLYESKPTAEEVAEVADTKINES